MMIGTTFVNGVQPSAFEEAVAKVVHPKNSNRRFPYEVGKLDLASSGDWRIFARWAQQPGQLGPDGMPVLVQIALSMSPPQRIPAESELPGPKQKGRPLRQHVAQVVFNHDWRSTEGVPFPGAILHYAMWHAAGSQGSVMLTVETEIHGSFKEKKFCMVWIEHGVSRTLNLLMDGDTVKVVG